MEVNKITDVVTEVGQLALNNRMTMRMPINPMDICTIVSILPKKIVEVKHTIQPGVFIIEKGSYEMPSLLHVGPSSWWKDPGPESEMIEIPTSSILIADSVINDWASGLDGYVKGQRQPGLFFVPGKKDVAQIFSEHRRELDIAATLQKNWFMALVLVADTLWSRTNGNPRVISNDAKMAAELLNLKNKPWMRDFTAIEMKNCPMCGELWNPAFPMCKNCRTIVDPVRAKELNLKQVSA